MTFLFRIQLVMCNLSRYDFLNVTIHLGTRPEQYGIPAWDPFGDMQLV